MMKPHKGHGYIDWVGDEEHFWYIETLWNASKDLAINQVKLDDLPWFEDDIGGLGDPPLWGKVAEHAKRSVDANLDYPIILNVNGDVMDGMHRIIKSFIQGNDTISAVQFEETPKPDRIKKRPDADG
jgi:hypothetical protein